MEGENENVTWTIGEGAKDFLDAHCIVHHCRLDLRKDQGPIQDSSRHKRRVSNRRDLSDNAVRDVDCISSILPTTCRADGSPKAQRLNMSQYPQSIMNGIVMDGPPKYSIAIHIPLRACPKQIIKQVRAFHQFRHTRCRALG
jgi:hypothetical protein